MFCQESASDIERQEFLTWAKENFEADTDEKKEAIEILSIYYVNTDMPLCGMKSWLKRDYERFCKGYKDTVERYRRRIYGNPNPSQQTKQIDTTLSVDNPNYRGPNGNWTLD